MNTPELHDSPGSSDSSQGTKILKCNVISVTYNNAETIENLLNSLNANAANIEKMVLVDNGSTDATCTVVESLQPNLKFSLEIIKSTNTGFAGGYRMAGAHITDPTIPTLCVNPDVVLHFEAVPALLNTLHLWSTIGIATCPLIGLDGVEDSASRRTLPKAGNSIVYALIGKLLPKSFRYNSKGPRSEGTVSLLPDGTEISDIEATTGALMLVSPNFRRANLDIFDTQYWMYGEDLQLCADARTEAFRVVMVETKPSFHLKGVSSGWPRSAQANRAFHEAMYIYFRKNMNPNWVTSFIVYVGIKVRQSSIETVGNCVRVLRKLSLNRRSQLG